MAIIKQDYGEIGGENTLIYDKVLNVKNSSKTYNNVKDCFVILQNASGQTTFYLMLIIQDGVVNSDSFYSSYASYSYDSTTHDLTITWTNSGIGGNIYILYDQY